jgi:tetratricopeptide (TPR) repeat protein
MPNPVCGHKLMSQPSSIQRARAKKLNAQGEALSEAGDTSAALAKYTEALSLDPDRPGTLYNIGLIHKYRLAWRESFEFNRRARDLAPDDEATCWNLAIAATALRDWTTARSVWNSLGMAIEPGDTPIESNFGQTPVRLNPDGAAEVVWAQRIDPVRARILNVPFESSGFRYDDVVLHDGAPVGTRLNAAGKERSVFNVLELFERSAFLTYEVELFAPGAADLEALTARCEEAGLPFEDWTETTRILCRACSEGRPHEGHDRDGGGSTEWQPRRRGGFAARDRAVLDRIFSEWGNGQRRALPLDGGDEQ